MIRIETIGRYEVLETLARGGMGVVYKARDPLIDRVVAIKTLGLGLSPIEAQTFRKRFAREAKSAGRLNHPNIVTIHDMGESDEGAYIAMEFLEGRTLRDILDSGVVLRPSVVVDIALQVAEGLAFAHQNEVVHCDVKPSNIMVLESGAVKIMDFGIARLPTGSRTFAGNVLGSPRYISPEQIVGQPIDARSDIFSLGAVLYEMLTGVPPFEGTAIDEILYQVINENPEPPSVRNRSLPSGFDEIVSRSMSKHPDHRYQSVPAFAAALRGLALEPERMSRASSPIPGPPVTAASPGSATVQLEPPALEAAPAAVPADPSFTRRSRRNVALFAVPAALAALGAGWIALSSDPGAHVPATRSETVPAVVATEPAEKQPTAATGLPAVLPPLLTRPEPPAREAPPMEANTTAAPAMVAAPSATSGAAEGTGRIGFAISPWGEIYVDGRRRGVTPPITELTLPSGTYTVEIRNAGFAPHAQTVELGADSTLRIKHKFR